jgi:glycine/D-amino acid oxidase-like deaminating enzyme
LSPTRAAAPHPLALPLPLPLPPPMSAAPPRRVVICGGGVVGACTAYFLATHAASPTVPTLVERCAPACAASGKAGGFLALDWCDSTPALSRLARASFALHRRLADALGGADAYGFRPVHTLSILLPPHPAASSSSPQHPLLPPWVDPSASAAPPRELGTPDTTAQVHPGLFTKAVLAASGAEVVIGEVERVVVARDGRVAGVVVKGRDGVLDADAVVLALGPWSGRLQVVSEVFDVSGLKAHSIVLRPREPEKVTPHCLFLSYQPEPGAKMLDPEVYPRPTGTPLPPLPRTCSDSRLAAELLRFNCPIRSFGSAHPGEVYICGMSKDENPPDDPATIVGEPDSIAMLHKIAGKVSSQLKKEEGAEVVAEQACYLPCTADGLPVIGEIPGVKGCYVATGHSCWGILNGPATGAALAELILDGKSKIVDLEPFSPARFLKRRSRRGV